MKKMLWAFVALLLFASCDMTHVQKNSRQGVDPHVTGGSGTGGGGGNNDDAAIAELERNGHYLMLYHLPAGVLAEHISSVRVTDGNRQVARADSPVLIASDGPAYANIYIPLISMGSPGGQFTRTGAFYIEFVAVIDALTRIVVRPEHQALTAFDDGRGVFDVESFIRRTPDAVESVNDPDVENQI